MWKPTKIAMAYLTEREKSLSIIVGRFPILVKQIKMQMDRETFVMMTMIMMVSMTR